VHGYILENTAQRQAEAARLAIEGNSVRTSPAAESPGFTGSTNGRSTTSSSDRLALRSASTADVQHMCDRLEQRIRELYGVNMPGGQQRHRGIYISLAA